MLRPMEVIGVIFIVIVTLIMFFFIGVLLVGVVSWFKPKPTKGNFKKRVANGQVTKEVHQIRRIFEAMEYQDEGVHYFIENHKGEVIYLCGQYLGDFLPSEDTVQLFPGEELKIYRNRKGKMIHMEPSGEPLKPSFSVPPVFSSEYYRKRKLPIDGEIISEGFDEMEKHLVRV